MPRSVTAWRPRPEEHGRDVGHHLVDQAGAQERGGQGRAALDHTPVHLRLGEGRQHRLGVARAQVPGGRRVVEDPGRGGQVAARPMTTRSGCWGQRLPSGWRAVSCGSSMSAVPVPTRIAPHSDAEPVDVGAGCLAGDPLARAVGGGAAAVEGGGQLPGHPGAPGGDQVCPGPVERARLVGQQAALHLDAVAPAGRRPLRPRAGWGRSGRRPRAPAPRHTAQRCTAGCGRCGCTARG